MNDHGPTRRHFTALLVWAILSTAAWCKDTFPQLETDSAPSDFVRMWGDFDPRIEPLEIEVLQEWEQDDTILRVVRFRIGVFHGSTARLAGIYGFPKTSDEAPDTFPGLLQIHGGGQFADANACITNAKRGYATLSIAWAGRISSSKHRVSSKEVQLFWDDKTEHPDYRVTTDWGAVDGYHAPSRNPGNSFPSLKAAEWTLDRIESPRNSGWFLCAVAGRRALTFLERQPEVDGNRLGVYGHSMGGKLTVMTAVDPRVKAAAPSCGGISDRYNDSELFRSTIGDDVSLRQLSCPIVFLSPANDFHGRIGDLPLAISEIQSKDWRLTCSPHHNHQDTSSYEAATLLWFDQHLKQEFSYPSTPELKLEFPSGSGTITSTINVDGSLPIEAVDVYYTQQGKHPETPADRLDTMHRFWHHSSAESTGSHWSTAMPLASNTSPVWVYANVTYKLKRPVSGAGYYYRTYTSDRLTVSSLVQFVSPERLREASVRPTLKPTRLIESFQPGWKYDWFTYQPDHWPRTTNKINHPLWEAPENARLSLDILANGSNQLVILIDSYAAVYDVQAGGKWQTVSLDREDFINAVGESLSDWRLGRQLKLSDLERLRPPRGSTASSRIVGRKWKGHAPQFRNLRWEISEKGNNRIGRSDDS